MPVFYDRLYVKFRRRGEGVDFEHGSAGFKVMIPRQLQRACGLDIIIAGSPESLITQLSPIVLYALRVRLVAERSGTVQEFEVAASWDPGIFP